MPLELTLVLAATRDMGIGLNGTLPWTGLKKEMAYFARVTKRLPPQAQPPALNAVIMGRKTWDSIPPKFRPLKGRLNIVISRSFTDPAGSGGSSSSNADADAEPVRAGSLEQAVRYLQARPAADVGRVFVIGGAQIYGAALELPEARRILLTRVLSDFECDTFFPLQLSEASGEGEAAAAAASEDGPGKGQKWVRETKAEHDSWAGEEVPNGIQEENGTSYEFQMWKRVD